MYMYRFVSACTYCHTVSELNTANHQVTGNCNGLIWTVVQSRKGQPPAPVAAQPVEGQQVPAEPHTDGSKTGRTHSHELCLLCEGILVHHGTGCCEGVSVHAVCTCIYTRTSPIGRHKESWFQNTHTHTPSIMYILFCSFLHAVICFRLPLILSATLWRSPKAWKYLQRTLWWRQVHVHVHTLSCLALLSFTTSLPLSQQGSKGRVTIQPPFSEQLGYRPIPLLLVSHKWREGQVRVQYSRVCELIVNSTNVLWSV